MANLCGRAVLAGDRPFLVDSGVAACATLEELATAPSSSRAGIGGASPANAPDLLPLAAS